MSKDFESSLMKVASVSFHLAAKFGKVLGENWEISHCASQMMKQASHENIPIDKKKKKEKKRSGASLLNS